MTDWEAKDASDEERWEALHGQEWRGMPEFESKWLRPWKTINVGFASREDLEAFARTIGQEVTDRTKTIWYPELEDMKVQGFMQYVSEEAERP